VGRSEVAVEGICDIGTACGRSEARGEDSGDELASDGLVAVGSRKEKKLCERECLCWAWSSVVVQLSGTVEVDPHDDPFSSRFSVQVFVKVHQH
jgi:hypothetical protein